MAAHQQHAVAELMANKNESEAPADGTTAVKGIEDSLIKTLGRSQLSGVLL